jgi:hypothetical protein
MYYIIFSQSYGLMTNGKPAGASCHWQYGIELNLEAL